jgi:hypothetical protein
MIYDTYKGIFINIVLDEMKKQRGGMGLCRRLSLKSEVGFER